MSRPPKHRSTNLFEQRTTKKRKMTPREFGWVIQLNLMTLVNLFGSLWRLYNKLYFFPVIFTLTAEKDNTIYLPLLFVWHSASATASGGYQVFSRSPKSASVRLEKVRSDEIQPHRQIPVARLRTKISCLPLFTLVLYQLTLPAQDGKYVYLRGG